MKSEELDGAKEPALDDVAITSTTNALGEVIITAVITAAVVPFVETLTMKAAEGSYTAAREWLRRRFRSEDDSDKSSPRLLVVRDPNPGLNLALYLGPDVSSEAIRALESFDLDAAADKAKDEKGAGIQVYWDEAAGCWQIAHRRRRGNRQ